MARQLLIVCPVWACRMPGWNDTSPSRSGCPHHAAGLFGAAGATVHEMGPPSPEQRAAFFEDVCHTLAYPPAPRAPREQRVPLQVRRSRCWNGACHLCL